MEVDRSGDHEDSSINRKRNSYSDSPKKEQCELCNRIFPWKSSLARHMITHTGIKPFKCPACAAMLSTKSNRERHMIRKHGMDIHDPDVVKLLEKPYVCEQCHTAATATATATAFATACELVSHYHEAHSEQEVPEKLTTQARVEANPNWLSVIPQDDAMSCQSELSEGKLSVQDFDEDDAEDGESLVLKSEKVFTSAVPFFSSPADRPKSYCECWKCSQRFLSHRELFDHLKNHSPDGHFRCNTCDAPFNTRLGSLMHVKLSHPTDYDNLAEKNGIVDVQAFSEEQDVLVEQRISGLLTEFHGVLPDPHNDVRGAEYVNRKLYCSVCPKRFSSLQDLRRHVRRHTGERPFACPMCRQRFTLKHCMVRHLRTHENQTRASPAATTTTTTAVCESDAASKTTTSAESPTVDNQDSGLLNSLLGVQDAQLNVMLNSPSNAENMLGMN